MNKDFFVAVDFDGTVVMHEWPEIGPEVPHCVEVLKALQEKKGAKIILHTMRGGKHLDEALKWFDQRGIVLLAANYNPTQNAWTNSTKVYAHVYIDDAAFGVPLVHGKHRRPFVDWQPIGEFLLGPGTMYQNIHNVSNPQSHNMLTSEELESNGFIRYDGKPVRGAKSTDFYTRPAGGPGCNLGIDLFEEQCFHYECDVPSRFPYPSDAHVMMDLPFPQSLEDVASIYYTLSGVKLLLSRNNIY